ITLDHKEVLKHVEHEAFYSHILTLIIDGKKQKVILKDMQRHPFKPKVTHMDFQRVSDKAVIHMQVPLHFINEEQSVGAKAGGLIQHSMNTVEVVCKAKDLPEFLEVDMAEVDLGQVVHLSDIKLPKGVQLVELTHGDDHDHPVVTIQKRGGGAEDASEEEEASEE
ncbi:MAG: 50S ribosomal protein L25/general stress protein Ctc, partial [Kangiellaceae bacterium]|nr:50S ribosomal protein L25/general stress protein Ctc [Kangiellaceae bacterium]